jgi:hypothetical protein
MYIMQVYDVGFLICFQLFYLGEGAVKQDANAQLYPDGRTDACHAANLVDNQEDEIKEIFAGQRDNFLPVCQLKLDCQGIFRIGMADQVIGYLGCATV